MRKTSSCASRQDCDHVHREIELPNLLPFGKETFDHVASTDIQKCVELGVRAIQLLVCYVYFSPLAKCNANVRLKTIKGPFVEIWTGSRWETHPLKSATRSIIYSTFRHIEHHVLQKNIQTNNTFDQFCDNIRKHNHTVLRLLQQQIIVAIHNRSVPTFPEKWCIPISNPSTTVCVENISSIVPFGCETIDHIDNVLKLACLKIGQRSIAAYIQLRFFHPSVPQNRNIVVRNSRNPYIHLWNGKSWCLETKTHVVNMLIDKAYNDVDFFIMCLGMNDATVPTMFRSFQKQYSMRMTRVLKEISNEVLCVLCNQ